MIKLDDVTLVLVETRQHAMGRLAVRDCLNKVKFGEVLIFTDKPVEFEGQGKIIEVPDWENKIGWSRFTWYGMAPYIETTHALCIQWDSWITDAKMWRLSYLDYDYIGAPWWYKDGMNVGNGGFCLRSSKLMRFLRKHRDRYPCITSLDDDLLCRKYRPALQQEGFVWAPEHLAIKFAFECPRDHERKDHFGFHAAYNFDYGCGFDRERIMERARIMEQSVYMRQNPMWEGFIKSNGWVVDELKKEKAAAG